MTSNQDPPIDENIVGIVSMSVFAAEEIFLFVGYADVDSVSARRVWRKMSGACPATASPGNVRIAVDRMASATSEGAMLCYGGKVNFVLPAPSLIVQRGCNRKRMKKQQSCHR